MTLGTSKGQIVVYVLLHVSEKCMKVSNQVAHAIDPTFEVNLIQIYQTGINLAYL
jgi:hypothetical protein